MERGNRQRDGDSAKGERQVFPMQKGDTTPAHWQNFIKCVRTREKPFSDVEFGCMSKPHLTWRCSAC